MSIGESMQQQAEEFRSRYTSVQRADRPRDRRPRRHRPRRADLPVRRRPLPARRRAGPGQDAAGAHAGRGARPELQPHPVHARPDAGRHPRHEHGHRERRTAGACSSSRRARSSRRFAWPTKSTAPRPRRSRPCSKRCRKARSPSPATVYKLEAAVLRHGHAEPDRAGRHLPAARGPARPLLLQAGRRLLAAARSWRRSSTARRAAIDDQARKGDGRRRDRAVAAADPRGDPRPARAGLHRAADAGHASRGAVRPADHQPVSPLGRAAPAARRRWPWPPRCGPCSKAATTSASRTSAASTCRPCGTA